MKKKSVEAFYQGHSLRAYELFGAHPCVEKGIKGVRFTTFAPKANKIQVIGSFNDWSCEGHYMKKADQNGIWSCFVEGAKVGDVYKYRIDQCSGRIVDKMDPYAFYSELRPNTASVVADLSMKWSDEKWMASRSIHLDQPVNIYEVHMGSWKHNEEGGWPTYRSIAKELIAYVKDHHFTHIELMPLNEHPFDGSWGYQCSGYFSVTSRYGSAQDLMYLVNACHKAGFGVIMDYVPVHFVRDDFSLARYDGSCVYEYEKDEDSYSQWGTSNFDLWKETVRSFLMSAAAFWIDRYHFDGLRMDAISNLIFWHGNKDRGENQGALDFIKRLIRHIPEKHFKMIRYGGLYARHRKIDSKLHHVISKEKHRIYRSFTQWRTAILLSFGYDPLYCPECNHKMELLELYYNHKRISLEEMYEKAMSKSRGKRSSS